MLRYNLFHCIVYSSVVTYATINEKTIKQLKKIFNNSKNDISFRLHHDQQTAHALESAAAYSSYPTMAGKF